MRPEAGAALADSLRHLIREAGPISVARYMALALAHPALGYYRRRDPLGAEGDFITAPEISQLFGELVGLALAQHWLDLGRPPRVLLAELGPGRGTLLADALRAARVVTGFPEAIALHLVETSPALRERQARALAPRPARWHDTLAGVPDDAPLLLVANEFLDALPVRQFVREGRHWRERLVAVDDEGAFHFVLARHVTPLPGLMLAGATDLPEGSVVELSSVREALVQELAARLAGQGGMALVIDYGGDERVPAGDTLQAVRHHRKVDPLATPGEADLSTHVDFHALIRPALAEGVAAYGPVTQAAFLNRLGIGLRLEQLLRHAGPAQREALASGHRRLTDPAEMGRLFKAMAFTSAGAPVPPGFTPEEKRTP